MASTYELVQTYTVSSATINVALTTIPSTYTDLVLVINPASSTEQNMQMYFNNDNATNYSRTYIQGSGTSTTSARQSSTTGQNNYLTPVFGGSNAGTYVANIFDYANTSKHKAFLFRGGTAASGTALLLSLWRSTSAISTINLYNGSDWAVGTRFDLYGIKAA